MNEANRSAADLPDFDALWDYAQPAETESKFRDLLPKAEASGNLAYHAVLLTQIARSRGLQRAFVDAHSILDKAEALISDDMVIPRIRYALERGRVFNSAKQKDVATRYFEEAFNLAQQHGEDFYAVDAAHMMGIAVPAEAQLTWNQRAMKIAESSTDDKAKKWLGALYNNIGWTHHDLKQYELALIMFEKGLQWREEQQDAPGAFIAKWTVARCYRSLGRTDEAIVLLNALREEMEQDAKQKDGYVYEELAENHLIHGDKALSKKYFGLAHALLSQDLWLQANEAGRLTRMQSLSE